MFHNLLPNAAFSLVTWDGTNYTVGAGVDGAVVLSGEIDMQGYDSLCVIASIGTIAASGVFTMFAKCSNTSGTYGSGTIDKIGTSIANDADTDDNKLFILDFHKIPRRYVKIVTQRTAGNGTELALIAIRYNAHLNPVTQSSSVGGVEASETFNNPTPRAT